MCLELLGCDLGDSIGGVGRWLKGKEVGEETADVWRGHGGTRDGVCGILAADPGGEDVEARSEDISALRPC